MAMASSPTSLRNQWIAGAIAGSIEAVCTMPFEAMKTRQQIDTNRGWRNSIHGKELSYHFAGLTPMLLQTSMKVGIRFAAFEQLKKGTSTAVAGFGAGGFEALVWIAPTERLKVLLISGGKEYRSLIKTTITILKSQGVRGLWRSASATVLRNSLTVGARFWLVEHIKSFLQLLTPTHERGKGLQSAGAGFLAGAITTVLNQPIDVVKTRMNADQLGFETARYKSNWHCAKSTWNEGGMRAFSAGLPARMMKISLGQGIIFFVYDSVVTRL